VSKKISSGEKRGNPKTFFGFITSEIQCWVHLKWLLVGRGGTNFQIENFPTTVKTGQKQKRRGESRENVDLRNSIATSKNRTFVK
jgi:hypothetical protein